MAQAYHRLDTDKAVFYYENEFYPLSSFSAFQLRWKGHTFMTLEHAYHWEKFPGPSEICVAILIATSAHEAFEIAQQFKDQQRPDWKDVRKPIMKAMMHAKADQHLYVAKKLEETGDRRLVEDSWRDSFWGWGPDHDGENWHGRLWEEVRAERRRAYAQINSMNQKVSP